MIAFRRLARQALSAYITRRHARRVAKANPTAAELQRQIAERDRKHRNAKPLRRQLGKVVNARLARELGVTLPEGLTS